MKMDKYLKMALIHFALAFVILVFMVFTGCTHTAIKKTCLDKAMGDAEAFFRQTRVPTFIAHGPADGYDRRHAEACYIGSNKYEFFRFENGQFTRIDKPIWFHPDKIDPMKVVQQRIARGAW